MAAPPEDGGDAARNRRLSGTIDPLKRDEAPTHDDLIRGGAEKCSRPMACDIRLVSAHTILIMSHFCGPAEPYWPRGVGTGSSEAQGRSPTGFRRGEPHRPV